MDLKANWREWQRRLRIWLVGFGWLGVVDRKGDVRKVAGGFSVLGLLFREQSCEGDDVSVDILLPDGRSAVAV